MTRILFALLLSVPAYATAITGRVTIGDAAAGGVTVTVTAESLQHPRTTITNARGAYFIDMLPPGLYDVTFSKSGMTTLTRRAKVELDRVARADAKLEPSADEDSVTSTATQNNVADTTAVTSHFDDATLDRLPGRDYAPAIAPDAYSPSAVAVDGITQFSTIVGPEETVQEVTVTRAGAPVQTESYGGRVLAIQRRSGREQFFLSLRDTISNEAWNDGGPFFQRGDGLRNRFEAYGGGRIVSQRLWFFASAWNGGDATRYTTRDRGVLLKLDGQVGAAHHFDATYARGGDRTYAETNAWSASLRHTGVFGTSVVTDTVISRSTESGLFPPAQGPIGPRHGEDFIATTVSYAAGDHVLTAGARAWDAQGYDSHALFVGDRWSAPRFVVDAGLRYGEVDGGRDSFEPRVAMTYDLRGDGTRAISATFGRYAFGNAGGPVQRVASVGFASTIGNTGTARIDLLRRTDAYDRTMHSLQLDTRYRLFDRFEAGATYTYSRFSDSNLFVLYEPAHSGNAWISAQLPLGPGEFGATMLQRYIQFRTFEISGLESRSVLPTDFALRYSFPISRVGVTFATDVVNAFGSKSYIVPRTVRVWTRVRL
ncbi:MAG TPA: carboxypeptidase-like regulatory domain-containing protein [Thermoanaerobaculia bacterium]|nr:carboxypeptidase-like regulatory domain-containing protein [Thermoanaerobaculia bacterium]